ncbi:hypothetical protein EBS02_10185 [bacterium]|nr:hypothetical protein [bacterium]
MRLNIIKSYLYKKADLFNLAQSILEELSIICTPVIGVSEDASLLLDEINYAKDKIKDTDIETLKRVMKNLRDNIERFRLPNMEEDSDRSESIKKSLQKMESFVKKTSSSS